MPSGLTFTGSLTTTSPAPTVPSFTNDLYLEPGPGTMAFIPDASDTFVTRAITGLHYGDRLRFKVITNGGAPRYTNSIFFSFAYDATTKLWTLSYEDGGGGPTPPSLTPSVGGADVFCTVDLGDRAITDIWIEGGWVEGGWDVYRINPPGATIEFLATLADATQKGIRPVRNEPGSGQFSINKSSPNATAAILKPGNLVKVRYPEIGYEHIFAFFMEKGDFTLVSSNEQGGEEITIGGRGALTYWDRAIWLSSKFVVPWWPATMETPPVAARGAVIVKAGTYRQYTIAAGVITGFANFTTTGFSAFFDTRQTYQWPSAASKRFLVRLITTEDPASPSYVGFFFHPHQAGVEESLRSYAIGSSILLSSISADKPGAILYRLWQEATDPARPTQPIPLMTVDFTATTDSTGAPWATTAALAGLTAELGETYLDTIAKLLSTGVIDVEMGPKLDMHAYNARGRTLTNPTFAAGKVRFVKGVNIADDLRREREDLPVATFIEVVGLDNIVSVASLPDAATRVTRETSATGDSNNETVLAAIGLADLQARLIRSDAIGFGIAVGNDDAAGLYLPGPPGSTTNGDFWVGDVVTLHTGAGEQDFNEAAQRVSAITITEDEAGNLEVMPEVGSVLGEAERRLYAGPQSGGGASFVTRSQFTDTEVAETSADLDLHLADTIDAHDASAISFVPTGTIAATDVQAAIAEVASETKATILVVIDGGGAAITTGVKGDITLDFACVIEAVTLLADQSGSIVVDIWKDTYVNYPPVVADTITAAAKPTISAATKAQDTTLTGWTTAIAAGDTLRFNVDSVATIQRVALGLKVRRS